jgi:hypothetical protein
MLLSMTLTQRAAGQMYQCSLVIKMHAQKFLQTSDQEGKLHLLAIDRALPALGDGPMLVINGVVAEQMELAEKRAADHSGH